MSPEDIKNALDGHATKIYQLELRDESHDARLSRLDKKYTQNEKNIAAIIELTAEIKKDLVALRESNINVPSESTEKQHIRLALIWAVSALFNAVVLVTMVTLL